MIPALFNDVLLAKIQTLLGDRGTKADRAVRWRDLGTIYDNSAARLTSIVLGQIPPGNFDPSGLEADIATNQADIAAALTAISANQTATTAAQNQLDTFQTAAEADLAALGGNVAGLTTALGVVATAADDANAAATTIAADLASNYYTVAGADFAIAAAKTEVNATIDSLAASVQGYQIPLDALSKVTVGAAVTAVLDAAALGQAGTIKVTEGATARTISGATNGASVLIPARTVLLLAGQRIKISVLAQKPSTGAATRFGIAYASADGDSGYMQADHDLTTDWGWFSFFYTVPAVAAGGDAYIGLFGDDTKTNKATKFAAISVDVAAVAGELPEISSLTASVSTNAAALATLEGYAAATYSWRVNAGGATAYLEAVAADDPVLGAASSLKIGADFFQVTAKSMLITGGVGSALNLDPNLLDPSAWDAADTPNIVTITDGLTGDQVLQGMAGVNKHFQSLRFNVFAGKTYRLRGTYRKSAGADGASIFRVYWFDAAGAALSYSDATVIAATTTFQEAVEIGILAPAGAVFARISVFPNYGNTVGYHEWQGIYLEEQINSSLIVEGSIYAYHLAAGSITSDKIDVAWLIGDRISASFLDVDSLLTLQVNAGLRYQKSSVNDDLTDGVYMGVDLDSLGANRFGLAASRTGGTGKRQSIKLASTTGLELLNARHFVSGITIPTNVTRDVVTAKTSLGAGAKTLKIEMVGGGASGGDYAGRFAALTPGNPGTATIVKVYDGATLKATYTAAGGSGEAGGLNGEASPYGAGGVSPGGAGGRGAGGGGGNVQYSSGTHDPYAVMRYAKGGKAGQYLSLGTIDVSAYADPQIEIVQIGAGGASVDAGGASGGLDSPMSASGAGGAGRVVYHVTNAQDIPADVVPLKPTASGSFSKPNGGGLQSFPDLGAGFWMIWSSATTLGIDYISQSDSSSLTGYPNCVSFFSSRTPLYQPGSGAYTVAYVFYSMGSWG